MTISKKLMAATVLTALTAIAPAAAFAATPSITSDAAYLNASTNTHIVSSTLLNTAVARASAKHAATTSAASAAASAFKNATSDVANDKSLAQCEAQAGVTGSLQNATLAQIQAVGNCEINTRTIYLQAYETRVNEMTKISSSTQATLEAKLQTNIRTLASIKATLDAGNSTTDALAEIKDITQDVRVFELVLPTTNITADANRQETTSASLQTEDNTLSTKNSGASSAVQGENAPLFADITAKLASVSSSTANALSTILPLTPDNGDKTILDSNNAAITSAKTMIKDGDTAIKSIMSDLKQIRLNLGS